MSTTRASLATVLALSLGVALQAQSFADAAKKAQEQRAKGDGWPASTRAVTSDGRSSGLEPAPMASNPDAVPPGRWTVSSDRSAMDDSTTVALRLVADAPVRAWLKAVTPTIILQYKERVLDTYVATDTAAAVEYGGSHAVRLRFDADAPKAEDWPESSDHAALFAPEPEQFLNRLRSTSRLVMEFTPFNAPPATVSFDTRGLQHFVNRLIETCPEKTVLHRFEYSPWGLRKRARSRADRIG